MIYLHDLHDLLLLLSRSEDLKNEHLGGKKENWTACPMYQTNTTTDGASMSGEEGKKLRTSHHQSKSDWEKSIFPLQPIFVVHISY